MHIFGGGEAPPCVGFTSTALPEARNTVFAESLQTGVSTSNALKVSNETASEERKLVSVFPCRDAKMLDAPSELRAYKEDLPHWYVLRATYGREKKAYDYMTSNGVTAFYPTTNVVKFIKGQRKVVVGSRLPNIFFAYGTFEQIKSFVYDNIHLPFLRFYYRHTHVGSKIEKAPLIVPDYQMDSLKIICNTDSDKTIISLEYVSKFEKGQLVRITDGIFKGVIGRVARYQGQQRVGVVVDGLVTVCTAYVPSAFLEKYL